MPVNNRQTHEHHATIHDPKDYVSFATMEDKGGPGVNFILGIRKDAGPEGGKSEIQSVRFDAKRWDVEKAKQWLADKKMTVINFTPGTIKEDGEGSPAPAAGDGAPTTTTSTMGDYKYAPKVMPMASHYGDYKKDRFDQSFMKTMKSKLNESVMSEKINNPDYLFYNIVNGKIVTGWEYKEDALDDKKEMEENGLTVKTLQRKGLKAFGLNPDDDKDWGSPSHNKQVASEDTESVMDEEKSEAYRKGYYGDTGKNPYEEGSEEAKEWELGLKDRQADQEEHGGKKDYDETEFTHTEAIDPHAAVLIAHTKAKSMDYYTKAAAELKGYDPQKFDLPALITKYNLAMKSAHPDAIKQLAHNLKSIAGVKNEADIKKLSDEEKRAINVLKVHPDNEIILKKSDTDKINQYFSLCQRGLCRWNINDDGTVTFTLE